MPVGVGYYNKPPSSRKSVLEKKLVPCSHSKLDLYLQPCYQCGKFCNCDLSSHYPDVLVRSLDRQTVRLNSIVVRGSGRLQSLLRKFQKEELKQHQKKKLDSKGPFDSGLGMEIKYGNEIIEIKDEVEVIEIKDEIEVIEIKDEIEVIEIDDTDDEAENKQETELLEYNTKIVDLREGGEKQIPTFGITARILLMIQKYMSFHLEQVDMAVEKEYRDREFFAYSVFPRPPKEPLNHFGFEDWEEEFFNFDPPTMFELIHAKGELYIWDLHWATEKWFHLFRGQPNVEQFGLGYYRNGDLESGSGCEDFIKKEVSNQKKTSKHGRPHIFYTRLHGHVFARKHKRGITGSSCVRRV